ncbi:MAG: PA2779 family protein [Thiohalobacterales bacterium]
MMQSTRYPMAWFLSVLLALMPIIPAQAAMIGTDQIINPAPTHQARDHVKEFLSSEAAQQQLLELGVSPDEVTRRIDSLSDSELARINQGIDQLNAGGGVLEVLLIIFIVFVITDVIGATDIFPFIKPVN